MKRPLVVFCLSMMLGTLVAYFSDSFGIILLIMAVLLVLCLFFRRRIPAPVLIGVGVLLFFGIGAFHSMADIHSNMGRFSEVAGQQVVIKGYIVSEPDIGEAKISYTVKTESVFTSGRERAIKGKILFSTQMGAHTKAYSYGREIEIRGVLNTPKGRRNPGGFDYRRYLLRSGISATIFANSDHVSVGGIRGANPVVRMGLQIRERIVRTINQSLPPQQAGLLNGMLIGYRSGLDKDVQSAFSNAGLSHIMAVSGMNIAFIVGPLVFLFKKFRIRQKIANPIIIAVLILFVFITGFSASVVRAVIMAVVVLTGQILRRESDVITSLSFSAVLLMLMEPGVLMDVGFQLSFGATLSLILFYGKMKQVFSFKFFPKFLTELLAVTIGAQLGVLPITAYYFNKISLISVVSNVLVVPLTGLITVLGFIMAIVGQVSIALSTGIGFVNCAFLTFILDITKFSASLPHAVLMVTTPSLVVIGVYYLLTLFFFWYRPKYREGVQPWMVVAVSGVLLAGVMITSMLPRGLEVIFLDVGEGDSTFIRTASGKTILIDGGGSASKLSTQSNIGETTLIPFLLDYGISKLDLVIATHGHDDHIQGLKPVLESFQVGCFAISDLPYQKELKGLMETAGKRGIPMETLKEGEKVRLDGQTFFEVLNPDGTISLDNTSLNNTSLVLKLHYKNIALLFTGDMEAEEEHRLVSKGLDLRSQVLKVAHHGSAGATTDEFLDRVHPLAAVISVGKNTFGHPSVPVLDKLQDCGVQIFRTDQCGAVVLTTDGERIRIHRTVNG